MSVDDLFGPLIDGDDVELALLAFLEHWMPTYVPAVVRIKDPDAERWPGGVGDPEELGKPAVLPLREFTVKHAAEEAWPESQLPMLLAHSPGFARPPVRYGDGRVEEFYLINLGAIASGVDTEDSKVLGRIYASAAAWAIHQHPDLDGFAKSTDRIDLKNFPITRNVEVERNLMAVTNILVITVDKAMDASQGPEEPLEEPNVSPGPRPKVEKTSLRVESGKAKVDELRDQGFFDDPE